MGLIRHKGNNASYHYDPDYSVTSESCIGCSMSLYQAAGHCECGYGYARKGKKESVKEKEILAVQQTDALLIGCVPNPASNRITFYYSLGNSTRSEMEIIDIYGKIISRFTLPEKSISYSMDCSGFRNGIYFYSLITDGKRIGTKKMVVIN